jgi:ABC-2 type transport system ATP-binding protein
VRPKANRSMSVRVDTGADVAVDGVSFVVPKDTVLGLLGPNGAGKTTTVRMMTTLTEPTSGGFTASAAVSWPA